MFNELSLPDNLQPLPLHLRSKHYSAASGYVYQYIFLGKQGHLHVFEVSADRSAPFRVSVDIAGEVLASCAERLGSTLRWNDEYAFAKMSLFDAFDERPDPESLKESIRPDLKRLISYMKVLRMLEDSAEDHD